MNVWIVSDGEKKGPYADYQVRKEIAEGRFARDTVGWHEGCAEWMPLSEMPLFAREFEREVAEDRKLVEPPPIPVVAGPVAGEGWQGWRPGVFWMRRFWARWLDLHLFAGVWWIGLYVAGADVGAVLRNL